MLYDPHDPKRATTLDHLPGSPRVNSTGEIEARPGIVLHLLVPPAAFVAMVAVALAGLIR